MTKSRAGIVQYEATLVLVVISLSLASVVYAGLRQEATLGPAPVFVNAETPIGGSPAIDRVDVNSSTSTTVSSLSLDGASSTGGILAFDGSSYSTSQGLCEAGDTTFFSVLAPQAGTLDVSTDGKAWVAGTWGTAVAVSPGWEEVMIQGGSACSVTLPGGVTVPAQWSRSSPVLSSIPAEGPLSGTAFTFYIPTEGASHALLLTSTGGFEDVSI